MLVRWIDNRRSRGDVSLFLDKKELFSIVSSGVNYFFPLLPILFTGNWKKNVAIFYVITMVGESIKESKVFGKKLAPEYQIIDIEEGLALFSVSPIKLSS